MDFTLAIEDLKVQAIIGILPFERKNPQTLLVQAQITYNYEDKKFIDYMAVKTLITTLLQTKNYGLLEESLQDISENLKQHFSGIDSLRLLIKKLDISSDFNVGVGLHRVFKNS